MLSRLAAKRAGSSLLAYPAVEAMATAVLAVCLLPAQPPQPLPDHTEASTPAQRPAPVPLTPERRGDILMVRKMYREAIETYREAPQSAIVLNKIGIAYHQIAQLDMAKRYYERSIKLDPRYSEAINNLGTIHYARRSYRRAISQYRKALKLAPNSASIYSNLGTALFARKKYDDALNAYIKALSLDPEVFEHRGSYGVMLEERTVDERAKYHYYLARTYAKAGMNDRALQYLRKAFEEGFKERRRLEEDPEFGNLRATPEYQELIKLTPRVL